MGIESTKVVLVELLDQHGRQLHLLFARITASRDAADELLQELFLKLLQSQAFRKADGQEAYLFRSAINLAFDWRRRALRRTTTELLDGDLAIDSQPPMEAMVTKEAAEQVLAAMAYLSESDREHLTLRYVQGESYEWMAEYFGSDIHTIRSRCSKAMARLRRLVGKQMAPGCSRE
jgi:RNA polymerase sigma-70 factor, ECF subfamily